MPDRLHPDRWRVRGWFVLKIIVTGACGFIGRTLVARLRGEGHNVVGVDRDGETDRLGEIADRDFLASLFADGCDAVVHLATVPGGAAEQDPDEARRVNIDATMMLADAAVAYGARPRFIFASSIAVFGDPLPKRVNDDTPLAPRLIYGAHKAMAEQWLATLTRRGALSAHCLRLPGIVARPPGPSGMKSAFMSEVFHALRAHQAFIAPVSPFATMWLMSVECAAANLAYAVCHDGEGAVTLPALYLSFADLVAEIARQTGADPGLVVYQPDAVLEAGFGTLPPLSTPMADRLGFTHDGTLAALVTKGLNS